MIGGVAGRLQRFDRRAAEFESVAFAKRRVRRIVRVMRGVEAGSDDVDVGRRRIRRAAGDDRSRRLLQRARRRGMVAMRVGDEDVAQPFALDRLEQGVEMARIGRARIDDRDVAAADDIGAGSLIGEGTRIGGDQASQERRDAFRSIGAGGDDGFALA